MRARLSVLSHDKYRAQRWVVSQKYENSYQKYLDSATFAQNDSKHASSYKRGAGMVWNAVCFKRDDSTLLRHYQIIHRKMERNQRMT